MVNVLIFTPSSHKWRINWKTALIFILIAAWMYLNRTDGVVEFVSFCEHVPSPFHTLKAHIPPAEFLCTRSILMLMIKGAFYCDDKLKCTATLKAIL